MEAGVDFWDRIGHDGIVAMGVEAPSARPDTVETVPGIARLDGTLGSRENLQVTPKDSQGNLIKRIERLIASGYSFTNGTFEHSIVVCQNGQSFFDVVVKKDLDGNTTYTITRKDYTPGHLSLQEMKYQIGADGSASPTESWVNRLAPQQAMSQEQQEQFSKSFRGSKVDAGATWSRFWESAGFGRQPEWN
ncbi:hypothetical protein HYU92_00015 [Candidatus Curtissbacteria bacterium]|nr:hypothetical protein [Candidatus Curtissbacteria bacterium]